MTLSNIKAVFNHDIATVWAVVTSLTDYAWRSDISKMEVLADGKTFTEYTNDGCATTFTVTAFEPMQRYEFDMENKNMQGHWIRMLFRRSRTNGY